MEKETREVFENVKTQLSEATRTMSRDEREKLYSAFHDWAYGQYEEALIDGYEQPDGEEE
ncbi:hypothetical protein HDR58_03665 [bacterium]|nr:hypothetical protein [bacterium]